MNDLLNLIDESKITLVGYTTEYENIKDELLSNISYHEIKEINSSFSISNQVRDLKINSIFANELKYYILIDMNTIYIDKNLPKLNVIRDIVYYINYINTNYKLIISTQMNKSLSSNEYYFRGGNNSLYMASLAFKFSQENDNIYADIIKNRMSNNDRILIK